MAYPMIIQGGMGAGVSGWLLARAVSKAGQLGVVAGTALPTILSRRLQSGEWDDRLQRALEAFPFPEVMKRVLNRYKGDARENTGAPFKLNPMPGIRQPQGLLELTVLANFVEVFLAKEGHKGVVGLNLLEKIQLPTLPSLFGAMLAGVDYVLMGAGIPRAIPGVLDGLSRGEPVEMKIDVQGALPGESFASSFDPSAFCGCPAPRLRRPRFLGIISSTTLAITLARKSNGSVDGFVVEGSTAGGHNAPPRAGGVLTSEGEPVYGPRDLPDLEKIRALGLPFWLAGSYGRTGRLAEARAKGAAGIQVGTAFAFCRESGIRQDIKDEMIRRSRSGTVRVFTDPLASPTGFPLKVVGIDGTVSEETVYRERSRICDLGYLRRPYRLPDGTVGYRCPGEPVEDYLRKGGSAEDTVGRKCVCNGLLATVGLGQIQADGSEEPPLVTAGDDLHRIAEFINPGEDSYSAGDVVERLLKADDIDSADSSSICGTESS